MRLAANPVVQAAAAGSICFCLLGAVGAGPGSPRASGLAFTEISAPLQVAAYEKFEITFHIAGSTAKNLQFPYDPSPPAGVAPTLEDFQGISVDAEFSPDGWNTVYRQPAFIYQEYRDGGLLTGGQGGRNRWLYPTGNSAWKVRFAPHLAGKWQYRLSAIDAGGSGKTAPAEFTVTPSSNKGFIRVSQRDPRYFEFDDGSVFLSPGVQATAQVQDGADRIAAEFDALQRTKIKLLRVWISNLYGASWLRWRGGRNKHDGYLPRAGILPFHDVVRDRDVMTLHLKYPQDWFDACYSDSGGVPLAVKQNSSYLISVTYWGDGISGPQAETNPRYGLVARISNTGAGCSETGASTAVTNYGGSTSDWQTVQGVWSSGANRFLPRLSVALENVRGGRAYVTSISVRELFPDGNLGPEIMDESSMEYESYFPDRVLRAMDDYLEIAEKHGVLLKVVLMEKNDHIFYKLDDDGTFVIGGEPDNPSGFYGLGRTLNKTRWLQRAWWRYVIARWGYSTSIHSWELVNEGDPYLVRHWELADEFGKFMHCQAFGMPVGAGDAAACTSNHPNRHMVTTSFWAGFPGYSSKTSRGFWGSPKYPNLDYADVHAYIPTSSAPDADKSAMESDSAYYHQWHSREFAALGLKLPLVRGEAGMVPRRGSTDDYAGLGLEQDVDGAWYHDFLWASLDSGALYEIYWYTIPHIYDPGKYDHRAAYLPLYNFIKGVPLNNGHYQDSGADVSGDPIQVIGQKDVVNGRAHLWIRNPLHTWKNAVNHAALSPISASVTIAGFRPNRKYALEWWETYRQDRQVLGTDQVSSDSDGRLTFAVKDLVTDVALKITPATSQ